MNDPATANTAGELERALALTREAEIELLRSILKGGWDQGCFVVESTIGEPIADTAVWLDEMAARERVGEIPDVDPHPQGLAHTDPPADIGFVILTQRCDLLRDLQREPLVEFAPCREVKGDELNEASKNSPRYVLVYRPTQAGFGWTIDLRSRIWLPKTRIPEFGKPLQALSDHATERAQFALRVGRRYSRKPLPARYVSHIQAPLRKLLAGEYTHRTAEFTDWLIFEPPDGKGMPIIVALINDGADVVLAENTFNEILENLDEKAREHIDVDKSRVEFRGEVRLAQYLDSYPIDLYEITYAAGAKRKKEIAAGKEPTTPEHRNPSV